MALCPEPTAAYPSMPPNAQVAIKVPRIPLDVLFVCLQLVRPSQSTSRSWFGLIKLHRTLSMIVLPIRSRLLVLKLSNPCKNF
jgi:hypothetical protein